MPESGFLGLVLFLLSPLVLWLVIRLCESIFDWIREFGTVPDKYRETAFLGEYTRTALHEMKQHNLSVTQQSEYHQTLEQIALAIYNNNLRDLRAGERHLRKMLGQSMPQRLLSKLSANAFYIPALLCVGIVMYAPYRWELEAGGANRLREAVPQVTAREILDRYPYAKRQFIWGDEYTNESAGSTKVKARRRLNLSQLILECGVVCLVGFLIQGLMIKRKTG